MSAPQKDLADYMIGGLLPAGHYRLKWFLVLAHCLIQIALFVILYINAGKGILSAFVVFIMTLGIIVGLFIWIAAAFWLGKASRVHRSIKILGQAAEAALRELLESGQVYFTSQDVIFGRHYAFFFKSGSIVAYDSIRRLHIAKSQAWNTKLLARNHDLMARTATGKWLLLARNRVYIGKPNTILREHIKSLIAHNAEIVLD